MRNEASWKPSMVKRRSDGTFALHMPTIYPGSMHVAKLQMDAYIPQIQEHIHGKTLDLGCGHVPYYEVYKPRATEIICADHASMMTADSHVDVAVDLNIPLPFADASFDSVLLTDVIAHVKYPSQLLKEMARVLKPEGKLVLTTPYIYWMAAPPQDYYHMSEFAIRLACEESALQIEHLDAYGGKWDVLLDTLNKMWTSQNGARLFRVVSKILRAMPGYQKSFQQRKNYPLGYVVVCRK